MSVDEQDLYSIKNYVQSNVGGDITDYQIIKQQQERNRELAKLRQTPEFKRRERAGMIKLQDNIEYARNACPHCKHFNVMAYSDANPSAAFIEGISATSGITGILTEKYGPNPALHAHLAAEHPKIIEQMKKKQQVTKLYRHKLYGQKFLDAHIPNTKTGNPKEDAEAAWRLREFASRIQSNPEFELQEITREIKQLERNYPFLKQERKKYEEELRNSPYSY